MRLQERKLKGLYEITLTPHLDSRGFWMRTFDRDILKSAGIERDWVQDSQTHTAKAHTLRGLHVQLPPYQEGKLISLIRGKMKWVVVDLRRGTDTFGRWDSVILSDDLHNSLYVERGFAHGCISLSDNCDLVIKADQRFTESHGAGIAWNDPELGIDWGIGDAAPIMSERDKSYPSFEGFRKSHGGL